MLVLYICASAAPAAAQSADALYADRANLSSATRAADLWTVAFRANPRDFETAWKLARVDYWLGGHTRAVEQKRRYEQGMEAARQAIAIAPGRPEGHFWLGANMGGLAETGGLSAGLHYRNAIKEQFETVLRSDPAFLSGSADRALGRWYHKVPRLFGGSRKEAEAHLKEALRYDPASTVTHYFLAELYVDDGRKADASSELQKVLDAPLSADFAPEDREWKAKARTLLRTLAQRP
jgi:tetratricopeptide (TPR) repeat protein